MNLLPLYNTVMLTVLGLKFFASCELKQFFEVKQWNGQQFRKDPQSLVPLASFLLRNWTHLYEEHDRTKLVVTRLLEEKGERRFSSESRTREPKNYWSCLKFRNFFLFSYYFLYIISGMKTTSPPLLRFVTSVLSSVSSHNCLIPFQIIPHFTEIPYLYRLYRQQWHHWNPSRSRTGPLVVLERHFEWWLCTPIILWIVSTTTTTWRMALLMDQFGPMQNRSW